MRLINRLFTIALGLFLISAGIAKFTTGHVFQYIEAQSGIDLFYPFLNNITGVLEILAGAALLYRPTRLAASILAAGLMAGAVALHLSPWLGISIPTGLSEGAAAPWEGTDFVASTSSMTFILAIVTGLRSLTIARTEYRSQQRRNPGIDQSSEAMTSEPVGA